MTMNCSARFAWRSRDRRHDEEGARSLRTPGVVGIRRTGQEGIEHAIRLGVLRRATACASLSCVTARSGGRAARAAIVAVTFGAAVSCSSSRERSGASIDPGETVSFEIYAHCGVQFLGVVNGVPWMADERGSDSNSWIPEGWEAAAGEPYGSLTAEVSLSNDGASIVAEYRDRSVTYRPVDVAPAELVECD